MNGSLKDRFKRHAFTRGIGLVVALAGFGEPASAAVIDNFEQGSFNLTAPAGASGSATQAGLAQFNCRSTSREVTVSSFSAAQPAGATLTLSNVDNEVATVMPDGGGSLALGYQSPVPYSLFPSSNDRIRVWVTVAPVAAGVGEVRVKIQDDAGVEESVGVTIAGPGNVDFLYASFTSVDLNRTQRIDVTLTAFDVGDYHIGDIRTLDTGQTMVDVFPLDETSVSGPPFPIALWWMGSAEDETGEVLPTGDVSMTLNDASVPLPCSPYCDGVPFRIQTGMPHATARLVETELWWNGPVGMSLPDESYLNFDIGLHLPPTFEYVQAFHGFSINSDGFTFVSILDWIDPGTGEPVFKSEHLVTGDLGEQPLEFVQIQRTPFDGSQPRMNLQLGIAPTGEAAPDLDSALLMLRFDESVMPIDGGTVSVPELAQVSPQLTARPSVMRSHTTFDVGGVDTVKRVVEVYEVSGRRVRSLTIPAGGSEVLWDGRNQWGSRAAAGVYFARLANVSSKSATRLVMLP